MSDVAKRLTAALADRYRKRITKSIAERDGRIFFTLESPESSIWTVSISGLAK